MAKKKKESKKAAPKQIVVRALIPFVDALTSRQYRAGDEVTGWSEERAQHFAERGLVEIIEVAADEPVGPQELPLAGPDEVKDGENGA